MREGRKGIAIVARRQRDYGTMAMRLRREGKRRKEA